MQPLNSNQTCCLLIVFPACLVFFLPFLCPSLCSTHMVEHLCYFRDVISLLWSDLSIDALTFEINFLSTPSYQLIISCIPVPTQRAKSLGTLQPSVFGYNKQDHVGLGDGCHYFLVCLGQFWFLPVFLV